MKISGRKGIQSLLSLLEIPVDGIVYGIEHVRIVNVVLDASLVFFDGYIVLIQNGLVVTASIIGCAIVRNMFGFQSPIGYVNIP